MYLNKSFIVGNITRDIELKALTNGTQVASFSVATNLVFKDQQGNKKEQVEFHNVVVFGKQAENCAKYLVKGQQVLVEGRITTRSWEDKNTKEKKYRTEIVADQVQFGAKPNGTPKQDTGRDDSGFNDFDTQTAAPSQPETKAEVKPSGYSGPLHSNAIDYPEETINLDDIPF